MIDVRLLLCSRWLSHTYLSAVRSNAATEMITAHSFSPPPTHGSVTPTMKSIQLKNRWRCQNYNIISALRGCLCRKNHSTNFAPKTIAKFIISFIHIPKTLNSLVRVLTQVSSVNAIPNCNKTCYIASSLPTFNAIHFVSRHKTTSHCIYTRLSGNCVNKFVRPSLFKSMFVNYNKYYVSLLLSRPHT